MSAAPSCSTNSIACLVLPIFSAAAISLATRNNSSIAIAAVVRIPGFLTMISVRIVAGIASRKFRTKSALDRCVPMIAVKSQNSA